MLQIAAGPYRQGSSIEERERAYQDYKETAGTESARKYGWFDTEAVATTASLPAFKFDKGPVTQAAYGEFVRATGAPAPRISEADWKAQRFSQRYRSEVEHYNWSGSYPPAEFAQHPVVLVPWSQARDYCQWRGKIVGEPRRLPTADEFEKAARGPGGAAYPWGDTYDKTKLNSAAGGLRKTSSVGSYPQGRSARGADDVAGNVFQWTSTPWTRQPGRMTVKGSAWDDHGGLGRAAAAHGRPQNIRHAIVGFRCAADL
jgi:formylglycine-generating enzyme required for sulfatase activity